MEASDHGPPLFLTVNASKHKLMGTIVSDLIVDVDAAADDATRELHLRTLFKRLTSILQLALNRAEKSHHGRPSYNFMITSARGGVVRVVAGDVIKFEVCMRGSHLPKDVGIKNICKKPDSGFTPGTAPIVKLMVWGKGGASGLGSSMITNNPEGVSSRWCCCHATGPSLSLSHTHTLSLSLCTGAHKDRRQVALLSGSSRASA